MDTHHDNKGYSEETCIRCGWVMGHSPLNCNNDDTPHIFPSQLNTIHTKGDIMPKKIFCIASSAAVAYSGALTLAVGVGLIRKYWNMPTVE
jgi:hypothetical protein